MAHPFPDLHNYTATSGLSFPWAEHNPNVIGTFDASLGADGVALGMVMIIRWADLLTACTELLGYSYRDATTGTSVLRRKLPWQHPYLNQLWVKRIGKVQGVRLEGTNFRTSPDDVIIKENFVVGLGGAGAGVTPNTGPWTDYNLALLTIAFWRPPYFIRTDSDIIVNGNPQEWLRYTDRNWQINTQFLSREGNSMEFQRTVGTPAKALFTGSVGQAVSHTKMTRTWYEVPEACIFETLVDKTPQGLATNLLYTQTVTTNPITGYIYDPGSPIGGCVNSPLGGDTDDSNEANRFFGCYMGTLRFDGVELKVRPLQLPPLLMQIPGFMGNEPISQTQYDVTFTFDLFDPPRSNMLLPRGHNLMPYTGDGFWYPVQTQKVVLGSPFRGTPFNYADFTDLFRVL